MQVALFNPILHGGGQNCPPKDKDEWNSKLEQAEGLRVFLCEQNLVLPISCRFEVTYISVKKVVGGLWGTVGGIFFDIPILNVIKLNGHNLC